MSHRKLLFALIAAVPVAALILYAVVGSAPRQSAASAATARSLGPAVQSGQSAPLEQRPQLQAEPTATPRPTPLPTPTPDPARPVSAPIMPRAVNSGAAPVRKPGTSDPNPTTQHVVVVDGESGAIIFQRNAYQPVAPASLTKIMTAIVALERGNPSDHVKINVDARQMPGDSVMGLQPGFDVTFQDLMYGLMLPSGDDAAIAIGRYIGGSDANFVRLMNEKAQWLGLKCTHFANPHGLDESDHYSCPADMVTMARYAMQNPEFRKIVRTESFDIRESNISYTIYNVNPLLGRYPGLDGVKTGFTDNAGKALVATAVRNGHRIYVAYMRSADGAMADGTLLLNWAFDSFTWPPNSGSKEP